MRFSVREEFDRSGMKFFEFVRTTVNHCLWDGEPTQPVTLVSAADHDNRIVITYALIRLDSAPLNPSCKAPRTASRSANSSICAGSLKPSTQQSYISCRPSSTSRGWNINILFSLAFSYVGGHEPLVMEGGKQERARGPS